MTGSENRVNAGATGMAAFGMTTVLLSLVNAGILPSDGLGVVLTLALIFGGLVQLVAGLLEAAQGNTFGTTVFLSYGAFWAWFGLLVLLGDVGIVNMARASSTFGVALLLWALVTLFFWGAALRLSRHIWITLLVAAITLILLGAGELSDATQLFVIGGWTGILDGVLALYGSVAILINETYGRGIIPLGAPTVQRENTEIPSTAVVR